MTEEKVTRRRTLIGKVVSDKRAKTVTVLIERRVKHELYGRYHRNHRKPSAFQDQELGGYQADPEGSDDLMALRVCAAPSCKTAHNVGRFALDSHCTPGSARQALDVDQFSIP
jgi:hypothetical protein